MAVMTEKPNALSSSRREGAWQFRLIFFAMFMVFLVAAVIERLLPWNWWSRLAGPRSKSVFGEAKEAASTYAPYAFMG